ncbi:CinA family protein, partial [Escherichia sp. HC-CC]
SSWTRANLTAKANTVSQSPAKCITGYGGPEGGEDGTPAGTVWFAWHIKGQTYTAVMHFAGDCETVLALAVRFALVQLLQLLL